MNKNNVEFKKTSLIIGAVLLIFVGFYYALYGTIYQYLSTIVNFLITKESIAKIIIDLGSGILYCAMFMIPAFLYIPFSRSIPRETGKNEKSHLTFTLSVLIVLSSIGIISASAYVNSLLGSVFGGAGNFISTDEKMTLAGFIVSAVIHAFVPAISEELLFRRTILRSLAPYGKAFAIISSAVMFGLMHQNAFQVFYATMAGIVIGYAYVKTNSFLCAFLIHFFNNLVSVIQQYMSSSLGEQASLVAGSILTVALSTLGLVSLIILIFIEKNKKSVYETGSFGKIEAPSLLYTSKPVTINRAKVFFLSPTVLIFTIISAILALLTLFS